MPLHEWLPQPGHLINMRNKTTSKCIHDDDASRPSNTFKGVLNGELQFFSSLIITAHMPSCPSLPSPAELLDRKMQSILPYINHRSDFVTGCDEDQVKENLQQYQENIKCNFDTKHNVQECMPPFLGTSVMVHKMEGDIWTYGIIVDMSEPIVHEGHCYKIKLSSGRIITRNSIHVCYSHALAKTYLTNTGKKAELKPNPIPIPESMYRPLLSG